MKTVISFFKEKEATRQSSAPESVVYEKELSNEQGAEQLLIQLAAFVQVVNIFR
jgi:hypothetical protein